jgi:hypothetical protein
MERFEDEGKSIGLIFDVSIRHSKNGRRIIDVLKKKMIDIARQLFVDGEDSFYLYHPEITEMVTTHGDQVCAIGNYNTDGWKFNMQNAFRQTLYVLLAEPLTSKKYLFFITDRITEKQSIEKALHINDKELIDCNFFLVGVGDHYDHQVLRSFENLENVRVIQLKDPSQLEPNLFREKDNGQISQCQTNERCQPIQFASGHHSSFSRSIRSSDAINEQHISSNEEQLLPIDSGGRLQSESEFLSYGDRECEKECGSSEANQCLENHQE